jgi:hypothetical protein
VAVGVAFAASRTDRERVHCSGWERVSSWQRPSSGLRAWRPRPSVPPSTTTATSTTSSSPPCRPTRFASPRSPSKCVTNISFAGRRWRLGRSSSRRVFALTPRSGRPHPLDRARPPTRRTCIGAASTPRRRRAHRPLSREWPPRRCYDFSASPIVGAGDDAHHA